MQQEAAEREQAAEERAWAEPSREGTAREEAGAECEVGEGLLQHVRRQEHSRSLLRVQRGR
jgi:hypothetical protein